MQIITAPYRIIKTITAVLLAIIEVTQNVKRQNRPGAQLARRQPATARPKRQTARRPPELVEGTRPVYQATARPKREAPSGRNEVPTGRSHRLLWAALDWSQAHGLNSVNWAAI